MGRNKINKDIYGAHITNNSNYSGIFDLPEVCCFPSSIPDYLCLYSEFKNYHKTEKTCVCFFQEDKIFDGQNGIFNSIIYKNEKALNRIKERFSGINYFISPDYSMWGDMPCYWQIQNIFKSRIVSLWMMDNLNAEVIPNLTYSDEKSLNWVFDGITECSTVALSLKGLLNKKEQKLLDKALAVAIKKIKPQTVVVYSVASEETTKKSLGVLYKNKINVVIPDNLMMQRNKILAQQKSYGKI